MLRYVIIVSRCCVKRNKRNVLITCFSVVDFRVSLDTVFKMLPLEKCRKKNLIHHEVYYLNIVYTNLDRV